MTPACVITASEEEIAAKQSNIFTISANDLDQLPIKYK